MHGGVVEGTATDDRERSPNAALDGRKAGRSGEKRVAVQEAWENDACRWPGSPPVSKEGRVRAVGLAPVPRQSPPPVLLLSPPYSSSTSSTTPGPPTLAAIATPCPSRAPPPHCPRSPQTSSTRPSMSALRASCPASSVGPGSHTRPGSCPRCVSAPIVLICPVILTAAVLLRPCRPTEGTQARPSFSQKRTSLLFTACLLLASPAPSRPLLSPSLALLPVAVARLRP